MSMSGGRSWENVGFQLDVVEAYVEKRKARTSYFFITDKCSEVGGCH